MAYTVYLAHIELTSYIHIIATMTSHLCQVTSTGGHSAKGLSKTFDNSVVAMVIDLLRQWCRIMVGSNEPLKIWWRMADSVYHAPPNFQ